MEIAPLRKLEKARLLAAAAVTPILYGQICYPGKTMNDKVKQACVRLNRALGFIKNTRCSEITYILLTP